MCIHAPAKHCNRHSEHPCHILCARCLSYLLIVRAGQQHDCNTDNVVLWQLCGVRGICLQSRHHFAAHCSAVPCSSICDSPETQSDSSQELLGRPTHYQASDHTSPTQVIQHISASTPDLQSNFDQIKNSKRYICLEAACCLVLLPHHAQGDIGIHIVSQAGAGSETKMDCRGR